MTWIVAGAAVWLVLAIAVGIVIGRGAALADQIDQRKAQSKPPALTLVGS